jgi:enoyl-CoA hydratase
VALVEVDVADRVAVLTVNDSERRNIVSRAMNDAIVAVIDQLEVRDDVGALVVTGAGTAFSAGADLGDLKRARTDADLRDLYSGFLRVADSVLPTIAAVNGPAVGAGMNLALACDVILAGRSARFDSRFISIGLHPGGGHTWRLARLVNRQTVMSMVLFGQSVSADAAVACGLALRCVDDASLVAEARALASRVAAAPPDLARRIKKTIVDLDGVATASDAIDQEVGPQVWSMGQPAFLDLVTRMEQQISRQDE